MLVRRLAVEDASVALDQASDADAVLAADIARFQSAHGIGPTGRLDQPTIAALNMSADQRISQIVANMQRWRWLPRPFEEKYIEVNTAEATLKVVDHGEIVLRSRIIAGKPATPTPMFSAKVVAVTFNPYWNIPLSIVRNEILPKERRHPGYMASQHILADGQGGALRQQPGGKNALGYLKLEMPNRFNAYLHDTPSRSLFERNDRHFSHGCMRVQNIRPLASYALSNDAAASIDSIDAAIASGINKTISLDRPLPVYVLYWTAIADKNGDMQFRPDIYGRDAALLAAMAGKRVAGRLSLNADCQAGSAG
jgi:murein L,D-transpeptidase YcbB/YkuD